MAKNASLYDYSGPRKELVRAIKNNIDRERLANALQISERKRPDAIGHIIVDAVKKAPIATFSGIPHVYSSSSGIYVPFDYHELKTAIDESLRKSAVPDGNYSKLGKVVGDTWSEVLCRKFMTDSSVIVMENGVFDTLDMKIHPYDEKYMTNMRIEYKYNINEVPVMWKSFLNKVLPDFDLQNMLQEFLAATFVDRRFAKIEHMLTLLGSGSNGKSVVFEVVMALLGEQNVSTFSIKDLINSNRGQQNLSCCNGKRLNYCSEMRTSQIGEDNADAFKSLVSGEPMMARSLYHEPYKATNIPLMMSNANKMPKLEDATYSLQRRMLIIPFNVTINEENQDKELAKKLKTELSGIFNWVMEGLVRLRLNKYQISVPDSVKALVRQYFADNNPVTRWVDEMRYYSRYTKGTESVAQWLKLSSMYSNFCKWCVENSEPTISNRKFSDLMESIGFIRTRHSDGLGFSFYRIPSREDIIAANMDLAISMQSEQYISSIQAAARENKTVRVVGIPELEVYLGLPEGILWKYFQAGTLEGAYSKLGDGKIVFDVKKVQQLLAEADFYRFLAGNENQIKKRVSHSLNGMRRTFNAYMETLGVPIRKYGDSEIVPKKAAGCVLVSDDWTYTPAKAEAVLATGKRMPDVSANNNN